MGKKLWQKAELGDRPFDVPGFRVAGADYLEEQFCLFVKVLEAKQMPEAREIFMARAHRLSCDPRCHPWRAFRTLTRLFNDLISYREFPEKRTHECADPSHSSSSVPPSQGSKAQGDGVQGPLFHDPISGSGSDSV